TAHVGGCGGGAWHHQSARGQAAGAGSTAGAGARPARTEREGARRGASMKRAALAILFLAAPAHAYVRQVTSNGTPIAFSSGCVFLTPDMAGTRDLPIDTVTAQIQVAANAWENAAGGGHGHAITHSTRRRGAPRG